MADEKLLTEDDDLDVIEVDQLPKPGEAPAAGADDAGDDIDAGADDAGDEDARLVADDDDDEADTTDAGTPAHKKRVKRRQIQKQARDRTLAEVATLREQNADFARQLAEIRGNQITQTETQIDERLSKVREDIGLADRILAKAIEAGNGDDAAAALRLRDEGKAAEQELIRSKGQVAERKTAAPDARINQLSSEWKTANASWYGNDQNSTAIANQIDGQVAADGYNPATPAYWQELSRRLQARFQPPDTNGATPPRKKTPPPQGQAREHAPASTRKEVYVTPERKQAMIDAGKWDDPVARAKMLKAYAQYDREQSA